MSKQANRKTRARQQRNAQTKELIPLVIGVSVVLFVVFVAFTMNQATSVNVIGTPRLQVDREKIELGNRIFDQPVRAAFVVKNIGDGALKLETPRVATVLEGC